MMQTDNMTWILQGQIPASLEEKTVAAGNLVYLSRRIVPVTSLLIAAARRDNFDRDPAGWTQWCREHMELDGSDRDHRRAIGDLLLDVRDQTAVYNTLFGLAFDKLLVLTRIPADQIAAFLSHHNVKTMNRDDVRTAVAEWLGEKPREKVETPELPGFTAALEAISSMEPEAICVRVADEAAANHALSAGLGLLGASLAYHKREKKDVELLQGLRASLLDEVKELEGIISECCIQHDDECCIQQTVVNNIRKIA